MLKIETERKTDGHWLAEVPDLSGETDEQSSAKVAALALHIVAERIENGESPPTESSGLFAET